MGVRPQEQRVALAPALRRELAATSEERAWLIGELVERNPGMADVLMQLEADDTLKTRLEIELLGQEQTQRPGACRAPSGQEALL